MRDPSTLAKRDTLPVKAIRKAHCDLFTRTHWIVGDLLFGGLSDDEFTDLRNAVIVRGGATLASIVKSADGLIELGITENEMAEAEKAVSAILQQGDDELDLVRPLPELVPGELNALSVDEVQRALPKVAARYSRGHIEKVLDSWRKL